MSSNKLCPLISVVVVNYNGLRYLKRTIPPIMRLEYSNYEVIVIDNCSDDGSLEYLKRTKGIRLIKSSCLRGKNFACNYAIKHAKGRYILLLDNDVILVDKKMLSNIYNFYKSLENVGCIGLSTYNEGERCSSNYGHFLGYYYTKEVPCFKLNRIKELSGIKIGFPCGQATFIKTKIWTCVGGYDPHLKFGGDDNDLGIKLWLMGYKNYLYSETIQMHIGIPERQDNKKYALKWEEMFYAHLYTIVKNYRFLNMIITLFLYSCFGFLKSVKQSLFRLDIRPFSGFFLGYYLFLKNLPVAIRKRKEVQSGRKIKDDIFLRIKPPRSD